MYDFIVVGSGPAGACLASGLARSKKAPTVLLLEAGSAGHAANHNLIGERYAAKDKYPSQNFGYKTVPQKILGGREIVYDRGKGLGGSTIINFCCYTVGPRDDYERWAREVEDDAFNWENAVRMRRNIESFEPSAADETCKVLKDLGATIASYIEAAREAGLGTNTDINSGNPLGMGISPSTNRHGKRITSAEAYLSDAPSNLTIITEAQVTRVVFEGKKAVGVIAGGREYRAAKDVILSAGAVDTPKILLLSGVGDKDELVDLGLKSIHHLPAVGKGLQDHLLSFASWRAIEGYTDWPAFYNNAEAVEKGYEQFAKDGSGPLSVFFADFGMGFFKLDEVRGTAEFAALPKHIQEHIQSPTVPAWELGCHFPNDMDPEHSHINLLTILQNPQSRGTVKLASANPEDPPVVDPAFLSHPYDRVCAIAAVRRMLDVAESQTLKAYRKEPFVAPKSRSDDDILEFWRLTGSTTWHPSCTLRMGPKGDPEACVDSDFRVHGLESLRAVDLSVLPFLPNCHPMSIAYMLGECAAEKMIRQYDLDS